MELYWTCLLLALLFGVTSAQVDCSSLPDGPHGSGCKSYTCCQGGQGTQVDCPPDCVFNHMTGKCDTPENVGPPCGEEKDCSNLPDGSYPDLPANCTWYFTCIGGNDLGSQMCIEGTVFSIYYQMCLWPWQVYPPCGTLPLPTAPPTVPPTTETNSWQSNNCDNYHCPT